MSLLDAMCADLNKKAGSVFITKGLNNKKIPRIPFSSARMNYMFYGGIPRGVMCEFYGDGGGGKTTTSLDLAANAQILFEQEYEEEVNELGSRKDLKVEEKKQLENLLANGPKKVVFMDAEGTLDSDWANTLGVNLDKMYIITPEDESAEQLLQMAEDLIRTGEVGLFILDSIGALFSEQASEKKIGERTYCGVAGALTVFSRKVSRVLTKTKCTLIAINQVQEDLDSQYNKFKTPGGKAFKHFCSIRVQFVKGPFMDEKGVDLTRSCETPAGNSVLVHIEKSKCFPTNRKEGCYSLMYADGIDIVADLIDICVMHGIIHKGGAWFKILEPDTGDIVVMDGEEMKFQGKAAVREHLLGDMETLNWLTECLSCVNTAV